MAQALAPARPRGHPRLLGVPAERPLVWKERESGNGEERSNKGAVGVLGEVLGT
jgi:hypothetical protein